MLKVCEENVANVMTYRDKCIGLGFRILEGYLNLLDVFSWRPSPSFHGFIYGPYSSIFAHIRPYSFIFMASFTIIFIDIGAYSSIYDTIYDHLRPFTTIYDRGPGKPDSFQNTRIVSFGNTRTP